MADGTTTIDDLQIEIGAKAQTANDAIDRLVTKLDRLQTSLSKVNGSQLTGLANGVDRLGKSMQVMNTIKTADFTRLATNLTKLGSINISALNSSASSLSHLSRALNTLNGANFDNKNLQNLINSVTRLSNANVGNLSNVDFSKIGNSINQLSTSLSNAPKIQQSIISMTNAVSNLSKFAQNIPIASSSLGDLGKSLNAFMSSVSSAPSVSENVIYFAQAIGTLSNAGTKAGVTAQNLSALGVGLVDLMTTLSKAPNVNKNIIDMTNALANLATQGAKVGSASKSIEKGLNRANNSATRASKSFGGLASAIGKFYASYFMVIRGIKGLYKSIESTADYVEAFNYYTVSFGKIAERWDSNWVNYGDENARNYSNSFVKTINSTFSKLSGVSFDPKTGLLSETGLKNLGLNLQQITQYAAQLGSMLDAVGQSGETTLATTNAFVKLAGDISSLYNIDYQEAADKIRSVLQGQSRAGYGFGWDTTMASLQATADKLNLSKPVSEMAQFEKQQLRILTILEQSRVAWGDQSNTINTLANQMRIFKNNVSEVAMMLGQLFVPVLAKIMPIVNGITIAIKRLLGSFANLLGIKIEDTGQGFNSMGEEVDGLTDSLDDATASAKKLKTVTLGIDELKINAPQEDSGASTGGVGGGIDLTDEILEATSEYEKVWEDAFNNMENKAQEWANKIEKIFEPITNPLKDLFKNASIGDWFSAGQDTSSIVSGIFDLFSKAISQVDWEEVGENIGEYLEGIDWKKVIASSIKLKFNLGKLIAEVWFSSFEVAPIETAIITAFGTMKFTGLGKIVSEKLKKAIMNTSLITALTKGWASLGGLGGILTADLALVMGAGTATEIGLTIGTGIIGGISAAFLGFNFGREIGKWINPEGSEFYDSFKFFGKDGFFASIFDDARSSIQGFGKLFDADESGLISIISTAFFGPIGTTIGNGINLLSEETFINFGNWLNESVLPWFTVEKWAEIAMNIPIAISNKWQEFTKWWETSGVKKWFDEKVKPWLSKETWETNMSGIKTAFSNTFKNVANGVIGWLNKIISAIESLVNNAISGLDGISDIINEIPGVEIEVSAPTISLPRIPTYEVGGYPKSASLFWANENGIPELVGNIGNQTAVASGTEITGISTAIYDTAQEEIALLREQNNLLMELLRKDMSVNIGDREIARANARGQKSLGYALIT